MDNGHNDDEDDDNNNEFISKEWFDHFIENENKYKHFHPSDIHSIAFTIVFIKCNGHIEKHVDTLQLKNPNIITSEELIYMIGKYNVYYRHCPLQHIIQYTITSTSNDYKIVLQNHENNIKDMTDNYVYDIALNPCIDMFHDLNEMILIFQEKQLKEQHLQNKTKNRKTKIIHLQTRRINKYM